MPKTKTKTNVSLLDEKERKEIEEMFDAALHFGHKKARKHPKMERFIYGQRNNVCIIDLKQTRECLKSALEFLKQKKEEAKKEGRKLLILFVGTKLAAKDMVKKLAEELEMPYVVEKWLGGILTNFEVISKRIESLKEMEKKAEEGEFDKYPKKEKIRMMRKLEKIKKRFEGLKRLERLPDIVFVVDAAKEALAVKEANYKKIPVVGICDTDGDPSQLTYPIPANDDALSALKYILDRVKKVLKD